MYADADLLEDSYIDFTISLQRSSGLRRWFKRQVVFSFHDQTPFLPLPEDQSLPLMEWALNWCVSNHYHQALVVHAAVVEKYGKALILPGQPGAGKSTLCAALVTLGGFRLLSDELTLLDLQSGRILPNPRPISLKNKAIEIIRELVPDSRISRVVHDTQKGSVGLLKPPANSLRDWQEEALPGAVVFPRFNPAVKGGTLQEMNKGVAFMQIANQSFNYSVLAEKGFNAIALHLDQAKCFAFEYDGNLDAAVAAMDELLADVG
ncbi:HprK-related kinase A [Bowmanella dokdonensis]